MLHINSVCFINHFCFKHILNVVKKGIKSDYFTSTVDCQIFILVLCFCVVWYLSQMLESISENVTMHLQWYFIDFLYMNILSRPVCTYFFLLLLVWPIKEVFVSSNSNEAINLSSNLLFCRKSEKKKPNKKVIESKQKKHFL